MHKNIEYTHSPKVVVIVGPPASGKSYTAEIMKDKFNFSKISLDGINAELSKKLNVKIEDLRSPEQSFYKEFKSTFVSMLRNLKYRNIVLDGCRVSHPHIFDAFQKSVFTVYGDYTILKCFYLNPPLDFRSKLHMKRKIQMTKKSIKNKVKGEKPVEWIERQKKKELYLHLEPVLPGFTVVENYENIVNWVEENLNSKHPQIQDRFENLIKLIAESESFNPFYQTVEVEGETIIKGFTDSSSTWDNVLSLDINFDNKSVCDFGCMHGYFSFKVEELGASPTGYDISHGSIDLAKKIASARNSKCHFEVKDVSKELGQEFDIIFAFNVLHRVQDFNLTTRNLLKNCSEAIFEIGKSQIEDVLPIALTKGFKIKKAINSHRVSSVIGPRCIVYMKRQH